MEEQVFDVTKQLNELGTRDLARWYYMLLKLQFISLVISSFRKNMFSTASRPGPTTKVSDRRLQVDFGVSKEM